MHSLYNAKGLSDWVKIEKSTTDYLSSCCYYFTVGVSKNRLRRVARWQKSKQAKKQRHYVAATLTSEKKNVFGNANADAKASALL